MAKLPIAARLLAVPMVIVALTALVDDLGKYRWFWPYDSTILSIAFLIGLLWYLFFGARMAAWAEEEQATREREDEEVR